MPIQKARAAAGDDPSPGPGITEVFTGIKLISVYIYICIILNLYLYYIILN